MTAFTPTGHWAGIRDANPASRSGAAIAIFACGLAVAMIVDAPAQAHSTRPRDRHIETRKETKIPQGPLHIAISIGSQRVTLYANGEPIARAAVSTGMRGHPTPTGVFSIIGKRKWHRSNIYSNAPMPYMQRLTWSGIALHAGVLPGYPASHGCIRVRTDFAKFLWSTTKLGARVIVSREEIAPVEFAHPRLFAPKAKSNEPPAETVAVANVDEKTEKTPETLVTEAEIDLRVAALEANAMALSEIAAAKLQAARRKGPISIFISRKTGKLYARQAFEPLFEMPVTIAEPERPIGTHVFTAMETIDDGAAMRWTAMSMPPERPTIDRKHRRDRDYSSRQRQTNTPIAQPTPLPASTAAEALDRIDIPQDTRDRIAELLMTGASLIVSDHGPGEETGKGTDFVILTRS